RGGEYKVWVTLVDDYINGCVLLGVAKGAALNTVDCGQTGSDKHGFIHSRSKTDNFKVRAANNNEFAIRLFDEAGNPIDGLTVTWTDTLGVNNSKHSLNNPN